MHSGVVSTAAWPLYAANTPYSACAALVLYAAASFVRHQRKHVVVAEPLPTLEESQLDDKPARLDGDDRSQAGVAVFVGKPVDDVLERVRRLKKRSDVPEEDPRLRKIGDIADELLQVHGRRRV